MTDTKVIQKGQVWFARLIGENNMETGLRPVIIFQNDAACRYSPNCTVVPLTTKSKRALPTHVTINKSSGLSHQSTALAENIITISKEMLISYIGEISNIEMAQIEKSILVQLGIISNINSQNLKVV